MLNADEDVDNRTGVNAVASEIALLMELKDNHPWRRAHLWKSAFLEEKF